MAKRCKIGDVIEIPTKKGLAYAQVSHFHKDYSALLRVLPGFFHARPQDLERCVGVNEKFVQFFPLQAALNQGIFEVVGNFKVPTHASEFPVFRTGVPDRETKKVDNWWFWDGEREWMVGEITAEQRKLPLRGICNDTYLIELIENEWTPENDSM